VVVDDLDAIAGPAEVDGPAGERVLANRRFLVFGDLLERRLAHVDDGGAAEVPVGLVPKSRNSASASRRRPSGPALTTWRVVPCGCSSSARRLATFNRISFRRVPLNWLRSPPALRWPGSTFLALPLLSVR